MCKLTPFQGVSKLHNKMTKQLLWFYIEGTESFRGYVVTLGHFHLRKYRMTTTHRVCCFHGTVILELEIDAFMTALNVTNQKIGWKPTDSGHGLTSTKFQKARAKEDKKRSVWYFARYFNLGGEDPDPVSNREFSSVSVQSHVFVARVWRRKEKRSLSQRLKGCMSFDLEKKWGLDHQRLEIDDNS